MGLLRSPPVDGIPWRDTLISGLGAVLIPSLVGIAAVGVLRLTGGNDGLLTAAMLLFLSPLLSGAGLILVLPGAGILLRQGWFGWAVALALGLAVGALIDAAVHYPAATPFGALVLIIMRALLGRLRDMG